MGFENEERSGILNEKRRKKERKKVEIKGKK